MAVDTTLLAEVKRVNADFLGEANYYAYRPENDVDYQHLLTAVERVENGAPLTSKQRDVLLGAISTYRGYLGPDQGELTGTAVAELRATIEAWPTLAGLDEVSDRAEVAPERRAAVEPEL